MAEVQRSAGTVKWFSGQKGFGFIAPDDGGDDLFVHQTEIRAEGFRFLREGQRVEFVMDSAEDGRNKAVDVVGLGRSSYRSGGDGGGGGSRGRGRRDFGGRGGGGGYGRFEGRGGGRTGGRYAAGGSGAECYNCGRIGHLARDCYQGAGDGGRGGGNRGYGGNGDVNRGGNGGGRGRGRGGGAGGGRACYNCGEEGHLARDCPNVQN